MALLTLVQLLPMHQLDMPVHMMLISKPHNALLTRKVLLVRMGQLMPLQLLLSLETLLANLTLELPHVVVRLIDVTLQLRGLLERPATKLATNNSV